MNRIISSITSENSIRKAVRQQLQSKTGSTPLHLTTEPQVFLIHESGTEIKFIGTQKSRKQSRINSILTDMGWGHPQSWINRLTAGRYQSFRERQIKRILREELQATKKDLAMTLFGEQKASISPITCPLWNNDLKTQERFLTTLTKNALEKLRKNEDFRLLKDKDLLLFSYLAKNPVLKEEILPVLFASEKELKQALNDCKRSKNLDAPLNQALLVYALALPTDLQLKEHSSKKLQKLAEKVQQTPGFQGPPSALKQKIQSLQGTTIETPQILTDYSYRKRILLENRFENERTSKLPLTQLIVNSKSHPLQNLQNEEYVKQLSQDSQIRIDLLKVLLLAEVFGQPEATLEETLFGSPSQASLLDPEYFQLDSQNSCEIHLQHTPASDPNDPSRTTTAQYIYYGKVLSKDPATKSPELFVSLTAEVSIEIPSETSPWKVFPFLIKEVRVAAPEKIPLLVTAEAKLLHQLKNPSAPGATTNTSRKVLTSAWAKQAVSDGSLNKNFQADFTQETHQPPTLSDLMQVIQKKETFTTEPGDQQTVAVPFTIEKTPSFVPTAVTEGELEKTLQELDIPTEKLPPCIYHCLNPQTWTSFPTYAKKNIPSNILDLLLSSAAKAPHPSSSRLTFHVEDPNRPQVSFTQILHGQPLQLTTEIRTTWQKAGQEWTLSDPEVRFTLTEVNSV